MTGWTRLSYRFRSSSKPFGNVRTAHSLLDTVRWRFSSRDPFVRIASADDGLYLSRVFFMRPFHPPLRVPWDEVWCSPVSGSGGGAYVDLKLGKDEQIPLTILERMARKLDLPNRVPTENSLPPGPNFDDLSDAFVESMAKKYDRSQVVAFNPTDFYCPTRCWAVRYNIHKRLQSWGRSRDPHPRVSRRIRVLC